MKVIGENIIHKGRFLDFKETKLILTDGKEKIWEKVSRKGPGAVGALVEHVDNQTFILVEQFRPPVNSRVLELVAGVIDKPGKTKEEIIAEEILEETGYIARSIEFVMSGPKSPGMTDEMSYDYYARVSGPRGEQNLGESEDIEVIEVEKKDINRLLEAKQKSGVLVSPGISAMLYKLLL
ncbi:MAG: NUDIX hydrolase [Candidatus Gracilibacteria bacterium]|nr:NUDIX hydrolase [Candidatus Gracilibacteria bacterium]